MAFLLNGVIIGHTKEFKSDDIRYDSRTAVLDHDSLLTKSYYNSNDFRVRWSNATAKPSDSEVEYILWSRTFPASATLKKAQEDSLRIYTYRFYYASKINEMAGELRRNIGKRLPKDQDNNWFDRTFPDLASPPTYAELVASLINTLEKEKDINKATEDFGDGIISKKLSNAINDQIDSSYYATRDADEASRNIRKSGIISFVKDKWGKPLSFEDIELIDTIPNPWNRRNLMLQAIEKNEGGPNQNLYGLLWKDLNGTEWDWIKDEKSEEKNESYPIRANYKYYSSHPKYRITKDSYNDDYLAFDDRGNLTRVIFPKFDMYWQFMGRHDSDVGKAIALMAYENNDYDIQSAQPPTLKYVRVQLDLQQLTGKARAQVDKAGDEMAKAFGQAVKDDVRYGNSKKGKAAARKNAANFFGAMLSAASANQDEAGSGWFSQIKHDYWDILKLGPYRMERISDTSVKYIYVNKELKPIIEMIVNYETSAPYKVKRTVTAKRIN